MVKLSHAQWRQIAAKFSSGETSPNIAKEFGVTASRVCQIVKRFKVKRPRRETGQSYKLTAKEYKEIKELYLSGVNGREIAKRYKLASAEPYRVLRRFNIKSRGPSEARRKLPLNENAFDRITEQSAYWAGFLMADGSIKRKGGSYQICLGLAIKDKEHIEKFKQFLKCGHKIRLHHYKKDGFLNPMMGASIVVQSKKIADRLATYGIVPNKTFIAKAGNIMKNNRHFWRGVIDGDGHLGLVNPSRRNRKQYAQLTLVGALPLVKQFLQFCKSRNPNIKVNPRPKENSFSVAFSAGSAMKIINVLYRHCSVFLHRKKETADTLLTIF